jgi:hypothetical protein
MSRYEALFEDEDNIFGGTPQSKFWDIIGQASDELVKDQIDMFFERFTAMEMILTKQYGEEGLNKKIQDFTFENGEELAYNKKSTYVELTGEVVCRLDS